MPNLTRTIFTGTIYLLFLSAYATAQDTYVYDNAGRLKSVTFGSGGPVTAYTYDDANNRTEEEITGVINTITCTYSGASPLNMRDLVDNDTGGACGETYSGTESVNVEITVTSDINGSGTSNTVADKYAVKTGTWPSSTYAISLKLIINNGVDLRGGGGRGGTGGEFYSSNGTAGKAGGHAIYMEEDLEIVNNGTINGGGGGGGGADGDGDCCTDDDYYAFYGGGGGGGGFPNGPKGFGGSDAGFPGANGIVGTTSGGGNGGNNGTFRAGGKGGNAGANGNNGSNGGGSGGAAGYGIKKNSNILVLTGSGTNSGTGS